MTLQERKMTFKEPKYDVLRTHEKYRSGSDPMRTFLRQESALGERSENVKGA